LIVAHLSRLVSTYRAANTAFLPVAGRSAKHHRGFCEALPQMFAGFLAVENPGWSGGRQAGWPALSGLI